MTAPDTDLSRRILVRPAEPHRVLELAHEYQRVATPEVPCPIHVRPPIDGWWEVVYPRGAPLWHFHNLAKWLEDCSPWPDKARSVIALSEGEGDYAYFLAPTTEPRWDRYLSGATAQCRAFQYDCATGKLLDDARLSVLTTPGLALMSRDVPYVLQKPRHEDPEGTVVVELRVSASPPFVVWVMPTPADLSETFPRTERDRAEEGETTWFQKLFGG